MKVVQTLVVVANEKEARFLVNSGVGKGLVQTDHLTGAEQPGYADTPGRSQATGGGARHGFDRSTDERTQRRDHFVDEILDKTKEIWAKNGYDRLILSAPSKTLGALRGKLDGPLAEALTAELSKDLVPIPLSELSDHFATVAAF
ncbi:baeRF12 domain-containing protein [Actibacterium pelagium]|uniref:Protein required for attachment to host cells n=1 Tax=Actibacterium pelagium TaxID=2029103 RepID=A0A917AEE4_9RHOB|nr:host attachment family protein [Actibacterium pelagium]GGE46965.1 hypothetical protein GCM10011517_13380 [Actibacterium pelagium]